MRTILEAQPVLEIRREPAGELLWQEKWYGCTALVEETRYEAAARGLVPDQPDRLEATVVTVPDGEKPTLAGLRVTLRHREIPAAVCSKEFSNIVVARHGREAAAELIVRGTLKEGDEYRIALTAVPSAPVPPPEPSAQDAPRFDATVVEQPYPLGPGSLADIGVPRALLSTVDKWRPVFVPQRVYDAAIEAAVAAFNAEVGTLLVGRLVEDPALLEAGCEARWALVVTDQVDVPGGIGTQASFTFPPESFRRARQLARLRGAGEHVVGSQHSHGWRCQACDHACEINNLFFSSDDVRMAEQFPIYGVFMVVGGDPKRDRNRPVANFYVRLDGVVQQIAVGIYTDGSSTASSPATALGTLHVRP